MISITYKRYGTWIHHRYTFALAGGRKAENSAPKSRKTLQEKPPHPSEKTHPWYLNNEGRTMNSLALLGNAFGAGGHGIPHLLACSQHR